MAPLTLPWTIPVVRHTRVFRLLFLPLSFLPSHMRGSDSTYDDLDPEDNVTDLAKIIRDEYFRMSTLIGSVGIDSILSDLLKSQQLQDAVTGLVTKVLGSPEFKAACQVLLKQLWNDLIQDPETLAQVIHLLQHALQDERIKEAAIQLVMEIVNDQDVLDELTALLRRLGKEKQVSFLGPVCLLKGR
jgi:hypothetical protein